LESMFPQDYHKEQFLKWKDEEGDKITVSSEQEWQHLLQMVKERPIKLYVTEGIVPYFKDGPSPQVQYFYEENKNEITQEHEVLNRLQQFVPQCLQHLFQKERILPYDLPDWIKDAVQIKRVPLQGNEVDLDINIPKLFEVMHRQSLKLLNDPHNFAFIQQAKILLQDMLAIIPKHAITLYNLSCAESLLGNKEEAIKTLKIAIEEGGYSNVDHMIKDEDLSNIREMPEFQQLVHSLQKNLKTMEIDKPIDIMDDWTKVEEEKQETPILSVGEQKWKSEIELLKEMGFGKNDQYFGPRCVTLFEKNAGDFSLVIQELLS